ncbi:MAG: cation diffusion facilitator family transporter [Candidatus Binatia bacterium]
MDRKREIRCLSFALAITLVYFVAEVVGGILTNSLALLSDAGHMLSDVGALFLSLLAFRMARRPVTTDKTYGYHRVEILAALLNGLSLWLIVGVIFHAAYNRLWNPPEVQSLGMLVVAALGLVVNVIAGTVLYQTHHHSLNVRGAFLHVFSDAMGSVGAIIAGLVMFFTGWYVADPLISIFIGLLILYTSWTLINESVSILMQSVPKGIRLAEVQAALEEVQGVSKIHDLHVWTVTSGVFTLSVHAVIDGEQQSQRVLNDMENTLKDRFQIEHTTIQLETEDRTDKEFQAF